jgi:two-component system, NtrC family, sensor kinase
VVDLQNMGDEFPEGQKHAQRLGLRAVLAVPLMREGVSIGSISLRRTEAQLFTQRQVALLETFADQAVIAIENTRLFEEVQARTRELQESLEYQTATSEILNVISRSPTDVQPVFDTIAANGLRLCDATFSAVSLYDGELLELVSVHNLRNPQAIDALRRAYPRPPAAGGATDQAILTREIAYIPDVRELTDYQHQALAQATSYRSIMAVPILRHGTPVGAITVTGASPGMFNERQIELLKTFADQAVIAIENTRLFEEVQARNRDLTALGEVGRAVSSTLDLKVVLKTIVDRAVDLSGTDGGSIFYYREEVGRFELGETSGLDQEVVAKFRNLDIAAGQTGLGEAMAKAQPLQVPDVIKRASNPLRDAALEAGLRAALIVPLLGAEGPLGEWSCSGDNRASSRRPSSASCRPSPTNRRSRSKMPTYSKRSPRRAAS